jgi:hypothetical protein
MGGFQDIPNTGILIPVMRLAIRSHVRHGFFMSIPPLGMPNAGGEPRLEAEARHERKL